MPRPLLGYTPKISVSNTAISSANQTQYPTKPGEYLHITNFSFGMDSVFQSNGSILGFLGSKDGGIGVVVVGDKDNPGTAIGLVNNFSQDWPPPGDEFIVEPNQVLTFQYACSSGTGTLQIVLTGYVYTTEEHMKWLQTHGRSI